MAAYYYPDRSTMTLQEFLHRELDRRKWTPADVEGRCGASRGSIRNILENPKAIPRLETLRRLGDLFEVPLWRMVEMAGFDAEIPSGTFSGRTARTVALINAMPWLAEALEHLSLLSPGQEEGVLKYLEWLARQQGQDPDSDRDDADQ